MEQIRRDVTAGIRSLRSRPGTSILAAVALALGIGLTSTMFSIVDGVFLRGLPFERAGQLLYVGEQDPRLPELRPRELPVNDYLELRAAQRSFEDLAAFTELGADVAADGVTPHHYQASRMTARAFTLLRVAPVMGRVLTDADAVDDGAPVVMISETAWRGQFEGDPNIVGRTIRVNRIPMTVIGVMRRGFGFPHDEDIWLPLPLRAAPARKDARSVQAFGRLRDGVDVEAGNVELRALAARLSAREAIPNLTGSAVPYVGRFISAQITSTLSVMLAAVFGVLLIACFNVTNLLLARAAERVREVGIRLAIGASRWRVIRQLLIEGLLLSAAGATAGVGIAFAGVAFFNATMADSTPPFWLTSASMRACCSSRRRWPSPPRSVPA
jgi:putative ABC transport system permease protein